MKVIRWVTSWDAEIGAWNKSQFHLVPDDLFMTLCKLRTFYDSRAQEPEIYSESDRATCKKCLSAYKKQQEKEEMK